MSGFRIVPMTEAHWRQFEAGQGYEITSKTQGIVAEDDRGIMAMVVIQNWTPGAVSLHSWIPRPIALRHGYLEEVFRYLFEKCNRSVVFGPVPANNIKAQRFNAHIGFEKVAEIPDGYDAGVPIQIWQMRRENCRWLGEQYGHWQECA